MSITKAMILAAGRGTRMKSLTLNTPKPLLTIAGVSMIVHHIEAFERAGIKDIVINVCYLKEQIMDAIGDGSKYGVNVQYSIEDELLETGGGIYKALPLLGDTPFIVVSADLYTDYPFESLKEHMLLGNRLAHLVLVDNPWYNPNGDFALQGSQITNYGKQMYNLAGIGVYHPKLFTDYVNQEYNPKSIESTNNINVIHNENINKDVKFQLAKPLRQAIEQNLVSGEHFSGMWQNIGSEEQLKQANQRHA